MRKERCLEEACETTMIARPGNRCGGVLFGTRDDPGHGCGGFFCAGHLVGRAGPFYCSLCWEGKKELERSPLEPQGLEVSEAWNMNVRCTVCWTPYTTSEDSFEAGGCSCPKCNSSKAQGI
jgi:hypothetical protein